MAKFKVGDRVRRVVESSWPEDYGTAGKEYDVISVEGFSGNIVVIAGRGAAAAAAFEPVAVAPATATLQIEAGKFYKTRDGRKVGHLHKFDRDSWQTVDRHCEFCGVLWRDDGRRYFEARDEGFDIVAEWADEPAAAHKFKVGDRVRFTDKVPGNFWFKPGETGTVVPRERGGFYLYDVKVDGADFDFPAHVDAEHIELINTEPPPIEVTLDIDMNPPMPPQVGDDVLIFGTISAINHSPRGTNYNIVFETQNRRMSLHFLDEDFIVDDRDCACADNDNGPPPFGGDRAKAFDALGSWLNSLAVSRAA